MDSFRVIEIRENVLADNDREAERLRDELRSRRLCLINLMSSPGSGKTTLLKRAVPALAQKYRIGVLEADIDSDVDARAMAAAGARTVQLHTGGACHLDAGMTRQGLETLGTEQLDLVFLENVGNLVCPAEFDTGAVRNVMILSVPEGDDKPLKYPLMFQKCDCVILSKMDTLGVFDFSEALARRRILDRNPRAVILPLSAKTGEGVAAFTDWIEKTVEQWRR